MIQYCSLHHGPPEPGDALYELWDGRKACMCCIVDAELTVERWWPELKDTEPVDARLDRILRQLGLEP